VALRHRLPVQLVTEALLSDGARNQDPATRAWNFSVGLYYKAGGVPWRLPQSGPDTCFVGVSFHHFRTTQRAIMRSSLAQAFSSDGEGFAIRGAGVPIGPDQGRNIHLTEQQSFNLAKDVLAEYELRTRGSPLRVVLHKTSFFDGGRTSGIFGCFERDAYRVYGHLGAESVSSATVRILSAESGYGLHG
jgi:hypothetical protein